jgi:2-oxoglutarate ferredoxin oxidoreductase subunit alpha
MSSVYTWKIGGPAGFGIMSTGPMFVKVLKASGYFVHGYPEYPSLIRGGYNCYQIAFGDSPVYAPYEKIDMYIALSDECFNRETFADDTFVIGDFANLKNADDIKGKKIDVPMLAIVKELGGPDIMRNSVAVGASAGLMGLEFSHLEKYLFESYKEKVAKLNIDAARKGYESVKDRHAGDCAKSDACTSSYLISGNEAASIGAIAGGLTFYSTYPMTPASSILHYMAKSTRKCGLVVKHTEDEISGINMAIGAAYAGARAMTGTSGGGFSLMNEGLGLAAITEVPVVLIVSQRPGPATGMPTWTEQGDLKFVLNSSQGEFVRAIYSPGSIEECYTQTFDALNLAEKYQVPVFVLLDRFLSESHFLSENMPETGEVDRGLIFEGNEEEPYAYFMRYEEKENNGVGVRSIPGTKGGLYIASSNEHTEEGFVSDRADVRKRQTERRFRKLDSIISEMPHPELIGKEDAPVTFVCFGSVKLMLLEAMKHTGKFNMIYFPAVHPLDWSKVKEMFKGRNLCVIENNFTAQLRGIIAENTGIIIEKTFLKYDGRPFFNEEIVRFVEEVAK